MFSQQQIDLVIWFIVLKATFSNISAISWRLALVVEEAGVFGGIYRPWTFNTYSVLVQEMRWDICVYVSVFLTSQASNCILIALFAQFFFFCCLLCHLSLIFYVWYVWDESVKVIPPVVKCLFVVEKTLIFNYVHTMCVWNILLWVRSCSKHMKAK
jgi:hypothetical protein